MMLVAEGLVMWLAYRVLRSGRMVPGMSPAEIRRLMGGFIAMCLTIDLPTHWGVLTYFSGPTKAN